MGLAAGEAELLLMNAVLTSTDLYRSCAALASFSGTFDFKHFILNLLLSWFGFDRRFEQTDKINGVWFALIEFGLVCFAYSTDTQTNKYLILINLICEFLLDYSTNKQTNNIIIFLYLI